MEDRTFKISFESDGKTYEGMVNPSERTHDDGRPASFHVILNHVNFGNLSFDRNRWLVDEQRPAPLIEETGKAIESYYNWSDGSTRN